MSQTEYDSDDPESGRMTFTEHLGELRDRIIRSGITIAVAVLICYLFSDAIFHVIARPLQPLAARAEALRSLEGPYIAAVSPDGELLWDGVLGGELASLDAVAVTADAEGRALLVANTTDSRKGAYGLVVTLSPTPPDSVRPYQVDAVRAWPGLRLQGAQPAPDGGIIVLADKTGQNAAETVPFDVIYERDPDEANPGASLRRALAPFLPERAAATAGAGSWVALSPFEAFLVKIRLSVIAGLIISLPLVLYQIRAFVFPGLRANERRIINTMLYGSSAMIIIGVGIAYFVIFPLILDVLIAWTPEGVLQQFRMSETVNQILKGLLAFAIAFQMPLVVLLLVYLDLLTPQVLKDYRRVAIVGMAVGAAFLTPPDPVSLTLMLGPLIILYEICIWASYIVIRKRDAAQAADRA